MSEPVQPPDPARRRFFRHFARDAVTSVGSVLGAAQSLQESSAEAARELLGVQIPLAAASAAEGVPVGGSTTLTTAAPGPQDASAAGWRAPFRWDGDACRIVDQRRLPDVLDDLVLRGAADTIHAINDGALVGSLVQAQVAAVTLAITAERSAESRPFARRATVRGAGNALRTARSGSAAMIATVTRMLDLLDAAGLEMPGEEVAALLRVEAERIIGEAVDDHGALVGHLIGAFPGAPGDALRILVSGSTGAMGGGQFGTALSAVQTIHHAGRPVQALIPEGRPSFEGSRIAAWELRQAGVQHAVLPDAAAAGCIGNGEADLVLVGGDLVAANGDVIAPVGAYALALACAASDIPFIVCATTLAIDLDRPDGVRATIEQGRPTTLLRVAGTRIAPDGTPVRNPLQDLVPFELVTAIVTEEGVHRPPFDDALAAAAAAAGERRARGSQLGAVKARVEAERLAAQAEAEAREAAEAAEAAAAAASPGAGTPPAAAAAVSPGAGTPHDPDAPTDPARAPVDLAVLRNPPRGPVG